MSILASPARPVQTTDVELEIEGVPYDLVQEFDMPTRELEEVMRNLGGRDKKEPGREKVGDLTLKLIKRNVGDVDVLKLKYQLAKNKQFSPVNVHEFPCFFRNTFNTWMVQMNECWVKSIKIENVNKSNSENVMLTVVLSVGTVVDVI